MFNTQAMEFISIVIFKEKAEEAISRLLALGLFHPVDIRHIEAQLEDLSPFQIEREYADWQALEVNLREVTRKLGLSVYGGDAKDIAEFSYAQIKEAVSGIEERTAPLIEQKEALLDQLNTKESLFSQIKEYFPLPLRKGSFYTFLETSVGRIEEKNLPALERSLTDAPHLIYPFGKDSSGKLNALFIGLRRDRAYIDKVLRDLAWERVEYPYQGRELSNEVEKKLKAEIAECKVHIADLDARVKAIAGESQGSLAKMQAFISVKKSVFEVKRYACTTETTALLSGWVPREEKDRVIDEIRKMKCSFYIEEKDPDAIDIPKEEVPVRLKHTPLLKPFGLLIDAYGLPRYGSVDPTLFVAVSFLLMFGAMFGDAGQGLVLVLASFFLGESRKEGIKQAAVLIRYCGLSATVFGLLYGSIFGIDFPSFWIKPMHDILQLFRISIYFGVGMISLGILLNVINALRDKDYIKAFLDKAGLVVGAMYWLAIAVVSKYLVSKTPASPIYLAFIGCGFVLIFLKPVITFIFTAHKEGNMLMLLMESLVEILEIFMGYLSNTVSFMRIAAYAITHTSLFLAIFELSRVLHTAGFMVIILGNILIILLEGLVASIQSVRLNYYEFFSKFFMTGSQPYKPLTLGLKEVEK